MNIFNPTLSVFLVLFGIFLFWFGGYDDSPGAQLLGFGIAVYGAVRLWRAWRKTHRMSGKTLKFTDVLAQEILAGRKTNTWRLFDDKALSKGDALSLVNSDTGEVFARAIIDEVPEATLGGCFEKMLPGAELYKDLHEAIELFRRYYGNRVDASTPVKIILFHLVSGDQRQ